MSYSLESSLAERARKKSPSLDMVARRPLSPQVAPLTLRPAPALIQPKRASLDSIRTERKSLVSQLRERSVSQSWARLLRRTELYGRRTKRLLARLIPDLSQNKMVYGSIVSGIAFGMVSMAFIAHYLGAGVFARSEEPMTTMVPETPVVTVAESLPSYDPNQDIFFEYFGQVTKEKYEESIREMVRGYPIEAMLPAILAQDRLTAAFLIGIAKKESNWGKRIPVLEGQDCFNYWGYRGIRRMMGSGGHTCFNSREDAVETVARRLEKLIQSEKLDTPEKMIVWKCGFSCEGHSRESVKKWISDVDMYFSQLSED